MIRRPHGKDIIAVIFALYRFGAWFRIRGCFFNHAIIKHPVKDIVAFAITARKHDSLGERS